MEIKFKEVDYHGYCPRCIHNDKKENEDPCWDCLTEGVNEDSHKPVYFEPIKQRRTKSENRKTVVRDSHS